MPYLVINTSIKYVLGKNEAQSLSMKGSRSYQASVFYFQGAFSGGV